MAEGGVRNKFLKSFHTASGLPIWLRISPERERENQRVLPVDSAVGPVDRSGHPACCFRVLNS